MTKTVTRFAALAMTVGGLLYALPGEAFDFSNYPISPGGVPTATLGKDMTCNKGQAHTGETWSCDFTESLGAGESENFIGRCEGDDPNVWFDAKVSAMDTKAVYCAGRSTTLMCRHTSLLGSVAATTASFTVRVDCAPSNRMLRPEPIDMSGLPGRPG